MKYGRNHLRYTIFTLIVGITCYYSAFAAENDNVKFVGFFSGKVWSSGSYVPAVIYFKKNTAGNIIGTYNFQEQNGIVDGKFSNCTVLRRYRKLICQWHDKYGSGNIDFDFSSDYTRFNGGWNGGKPGSYHPWFGSRSTKQL